MRAIWTLPFALLAGCGLMRDTGVSDRCADMVKSAWPGGVDITSRHASVDGVTETADVAGSEEGTPIAARCRFERDVLTDFQWLDGPYAAASGSSRPPPEMSGHQ